MDSGLDLRDAGLQAHRGAWEFMDSSDHQTAGQSTTSRTGASKPFVVVVVGLAVLVGFTLGLLTTDILGDSGRASGPLFDEKRVTSLFERVSPAVVEINITRPGGQPGLPGGLGSGFLVDRQGHILTNNHVVSGGGNIVVRLADGRTLEATTLGTSPADDLALLQVDPDEVADIKPLTLADSDDVRPGQMALAIGSPFTQFNSLSVGVVSGTGRGPVSVIRRPIPDMIQTDAPLNPGNSGGPLLNSKGEVIGVTSSVSAAPSQTIEEYRIGFAVPSNTVRDLMPQLLKSQLVRRPWLGIGGSPVSDALGAASGLPSGILVRGVFPDSPAQKAGLVPVQSLGPNPRGDVITAVDGRPVASVEDMVSYFNRLEPGAKVTLSVYRDAQTIEVEITLVEWPDT